jgi:hypothetical protein
VEISLAHFLTPAIVPFLSSFFLLIDKWTASAILDRQTDIAAALEVHCTFFKRAKKVGVFIFGLERKSQGALKFE